jgi:hypothetical protein
MQRAWCCFALALRDGCSVLRTALGFELVLHESNRRASTKGNRWFRMSENQTCLPMASCVKSFSAVFRVPASCTSVLDVKSAEAIQHLRGRLSTNACSDNSPGSLLPTVLEIVNATDAGARQAAEHRRPKRFTSTAGRCGHLFGVVRQRAMGKRELAGRSARSRGANARVKTVRNLKQPAKSPSLRKTGHAPAGRPFGRSDQRCAR